MLLRSRLLFPESPNAAEAAERDAAAALWQIDDLAAVRAAAAWLGEQPMLGQDVFVRGAPNRLGVHLETDHEVDVIAFLWASLSLSDDATDEQDTVVGYRPAWTDLYSVTEARDRILRLLGEGADGEALRQFLPKALTAAEPGEPPEHPLRLYAAWATTFGASLELAKQGDVDLAQADAFASVHVSRPTAPPHQGLLRTDRLDSIPLRGGRP